MANPPGTPDSRRAAHQAAMTAASTSTTMPDMTDAAVRQSMADKMKLLLAQRGRARTLISGRLGDMTPTPLIKPAIARGT